MTYAQAIAAHDNVELSLRGFSEQVARDLMIGGLEADRVVAEAKVKQQALMHPGLLWECWRLPGV